MIQNLLVVCVGNICRSPMAEGLFASALQQSVQAGMKIESAGIGAPVGRPADPIALELMAEKGIDISGHRARQLDFDLVYNCDLLLVMESWHKDEILRFFPAAQGKVHLLCEEDKSDIIDPYRGSRKTFEGSLNNIEKGVSNCLARLEK